MREKIKNYFANKPRLKQFVLELWTHPYSARTRWWARTFIYPFIIKRGRGSIIRRTARLDLNPANLLRIGEKTIIEDYVILNNGIGDIIIGDNTLIASTALILAPINIGSNVVIGHGTRATALTHNYEDVTRPIKSQGVSGHLITISDDVWIGGNSVLIQGITIGTHSLVGAGAVVTKDVPPYTIVAGNPAKPIKRYDFEKNAWVKVDK